MPGRSRNPTEPRKGQPSVQLSRAGIRTPAARAILRSRLRARDADVTRIVEVAWEAYDEYRKSPRTRRAGAGFADPDYELPVEWLEARKAVRAAERRQQEPQGPQPHPADQRRRAARPDLPRRDVEDVPPREARRARGRAAARLRMRLPRPQPSHRRVRAPDPALQGLRLDRHAALPLALLLLSQSRASAR